ncbi:MAG: hypothetical protein QFB86_02575 [Patescibacteria group bacterium]|nr:hypothetical protein [Patescibacteria group bacterium]
MKQITNYNFVHPNQQGKVVVKVFWLTSIILSILGTLILNLLLN